MTNVTLTSHTIVAPVTTSLIRLDPICMLSPLLGHMSLD
jgi:hypothetical protein